MTEKWLQQNYFLSLGELAPPDCEFFSTPRHTGHGGGVATVFKSNFKNKKLHTDVYSSFEVQLMRIDIGGPVLCALVYRPPKYNKDFIQQLSFRVSC